MGLIMLESWLRIILSASSYCVMLKLKLALEYLENCEIRMSDAGSTKKTNSTPGTLLSSPPTPSPTIQERRGGK